MAEKIHELWGEYECLAPRHKVGVVAELAAGAWYPLAGLVMWLLFRVRKSRRVFYVAPLVGAVCSLLLFTLQFTFAKVWGA